MFYSFFVYFVELTFLLLLLYKTEFSLDFIFFLNNVLDQERDMLHPYFFIYFTTKAASIILKSKLRAYPK